MIKFCPSFEKDVVTDPISPLVTCPVSLLNFTKWKERKQFLVFNTNSLLIEREQNLCKILVIAKQVTVSLVLKQIRGIKK